MKNSNLLLRNTQTFNASLTMIFTFKSSYFSRKLDSEIWCFFFRKIWHEVHFMKAQYFQWKLETGFCFQKLKFLMKIRHWAFLPKVRLFYENLCTYFYCQKLDVFNKNRHWVFLTEAQNLDFFKNVWHWIVFKSSLIQ